MATSNQSHGKRSLYMVRLEVAGMGVEPTFSRLWAWREAVSLARYI